jgi:branched-chain amino acid transport system substrate-binding protein
MRRVTSRLVALLFACSLANPAIGSPGSQEPSGAPGEKGTIRIGFIGSLSSVGAELGKRLLNGMNLYLDEIHHTMAGKKVELFVENDESNPATGVAKVHKLLEQDKATLLCGIMFAHILYGIAPTVDKLQVPFVIMVSGADDITQRRRTKWMVRTSYTSSQPGHVMGDYAYKKLGFKRVVTMASDYPYGYEIVGGFQRSFEENGGQVVQKLWAPLGFKDFTSLLKQVRKDADAIFMCMVGPSVEITAKQYKELGLKLPIIGCTTNFDETFYQRMGDDMVGAIGASPYFAAIKTPANQHFVEAYKAKYGDQPSFDTEFGYTAAKYIHKAVEAVKGNVDDKEKFLAALRKTQLNDAPRGPIKIDSYGAPVDNIYIGKVERVNGKLQNTVIHTYPMVSQFWRWKPEEYLQQPLYTEDYPPCTHCAEQHN